VYEFNYTKQAPNVKSGWTGKNPTRQKTIQPHGKMCEGKGMEDQKDVFNAMPLTI
jgi:hypothetical protein